MNEKILSKILWDILTGLKFLKQNKIIHGDIKPVNIMYDKNNDKYKIIDFGSATFITE